MKNSQELKAIFNFRGNGNPKVLIQSDAYSSGLDLHEAYKQ